MSSSFDRQVRYKVISAVAGVVLAVGVVGVQQPQVLGFEETNFSPGSCDDEVIDRPGGPSKDRELSSRGRTIDVP